MDFGERLVELRERFLVPLPSRVRVVRLFITIYTDFMCGVLSLLTRDPVEQPSFIAIHDEQFAAIKEEFRSLSGIFCSAEQVEQAHVLVVEIMEHYQKHVTADMERWLATLNAAMFLSSMTSILLLLSGFFCIMTDHLAACYYVLVAFLFIHGIAITIHTSKWFRP